MSLRIALVVALAAGCTPHTAEIGEGTFTAFLAASTSRNILEDQLDLDGFAEHWQIDCRDLDDEDLLPDRLDVCGDVNDFDHEQWLTFDGFEVVQEPLDPWRGEAIVTSEGDLQLTFHQRLPGGKDFRFAFVVDPQFQPKECVLDENGESVSVDVDGGNWLENWSADVDSGTLYYINAGSYQFNPSDLDDIWILPDEWLAGFAGTKFAQEDMYLRAVRYGAPAAYGGYEVEGSGVGVRDLFYDGSLQEGEDPTASTSYQELIGEVETVRDEVAAELAVVGVEDLAPRVHTNEWRTVDGASAGLDAWVELHYNWVRFDQQPADLAVGNPATGEFHLWLDSADSQSKIFIRGTFNVDKIRKDKFTVQNLQEEKLEEYGTSLCGDSVAEAE